MLTLSRYAGETVFIELGGEMVAVRVKRIHGGRVSLGVLAPPSVKVHRAEVALEVEGWKDRVNALLDECARKGPSRRLA